MKKRGERQRIPAWARWQRLDDMVWISENLPLFWPAAQQQYAEHGRGAIVVDTTVQPPGAGHPFIYCPQAQIDDTDDRDAQRMVREYDPVTEIVIVVLKDKDLMSAYRIVVSTQLRTEYSAESEDEG